MHGWFDRSGKTDRNAHGSWRIGFFVLPVLLVIALIGLALTRPNASKWISQAVEAEFTGANDGAVVAPVQLARPATEIRTVRAK